MQLCTYKASRQMEELFGLDDGLWALLDFLKLLDSVFEDFDFLKQTIG